MYQVKVSFQEVVGEETRHFEEYDFFSTKRGVVRFIAKIVGETQAAIAAEVNAKTDSTLCRDSQGWRAQVWYS